MPPGHAENLHGWREKSSLNQDLCYIDVPLNGRRPYTFEPLPAQLPRWPVEVTMKAAADRCMFYDARGRGLPVRPPAEAIYEAPNRDRGQRQRWTPVVTVQSTMRENRRRRRPAVVRPTMQDIAAGLSAEETETARAAGCMYNFNEAAPAGLKRDAPAKFHPPGPYDVPGTRSTERRHTPAQYVGAHTLPKSEKEHRKSPHGRAAVNGTAASSPPRSIRGTSKTMSRSGRAAACTTGAAPAPWEDWIKEATDRRR